MPGLQFANLRDKLETYLTEEQIDNIARAFTFAQSAHEGQKRRSGEPYISHPLAVAEILADMRLDYPSIMAAILHDVLEDTETSKAEIAKQFSNGIAEIVDGVSKLKKIKFETKKHEQAQNLRKMMLAMAEDIRVIIVKMADRLHNMRTLGALDVKKRRRIALETIEIYAPIANRLGMYNFKTEFEDLGFKNLYPRRHRVLVSAIKKARGNRKEVISTIENAINDCLNEAKITVIKAYGREKHLYGIYKKMHAKKLSFSEVTDVYAFRIIVKTISECYQVLGAIHSLYKPVPNRFKDYIAIPKPNGYQSLHTVLQGPYSLPIEVQIRTIEMDQMAMSGIAAHWLYKSKEPELEAQTGAREWLKDLLEIQATSGSSLEFLENVKIDLYPEAVYIFTPRGKILSLPVGATAIDFAYAVHTDVGNACVAVKIDRRLAPLNSKLLNGQTVEVITAKGAHPSPAWLSFVTTAKARSNIRNWLKSQHLDEALAFGRRLLERSLGTLSFSLEEISKERLQEVLKEYKLENIDSLYKEIGSGNRLPMLVAKSLIPFDEEENSLTVKENTSVAIKGTEGMIVSYAKCCYPIPGDPIIGYLSSGKGIVIHHENCKNVTEFLNKPEKCLYAHWDDSVSGDYQVQIKVDVINGKGVLAKIAASLSEDEANIVNISIDERDGRQNTLIFVVTVKGRNHLAKIIRHIRTIKPVIKIARSLN